jgi:hypothetical protein
MTREERNLSRWRRPVRMAIATPFYFVAFVLFSIELGFTMIAETISGETKP